MKSLRPDHLITALIKMGGILVASSEDSVYPHIEMALDSLFRRRLSVSASQNSQVAFAFLLVGINCLYLPEENIQII
jgi:hypothetical protein